MKKNRRRSGFPDVSKAFCTMASDLISIADNIDKARELAYISVIAWNISLYPQDQIVEKIELVAKEYEKSNPGVIQAELMSQDLQRLVDKKLKEFPDIKRTITKVGVEEKGEKYVITTVSVPFALQ
jgi:hypothetical protein